MESLRRVPYGEVYHELLGSAAQLLVKNPCFNFGAIKFTGNHNDNKSLISFVEQMLDNDYKLNINEKEFNLNDSFKEMYKDSNISKDSVDTILSEITGYSFDQCSQLLVQAAKPKVQAMPASELANSPEAKAIPGDTGSVLAGDPGMTL